MAVAGVASFVGTADGTVDEPMSPKTSTRRLALLAGWVTGAAGAVLMFRRSVAAAVPPYSIKSIKI